MTAQPEPSRTFRRSAARQAFDGAAAGCGGVLFLGAGLFFLVSAGSFDLLFRLIGLLGFGFFGILMLAGAVAMAQRGGDTRVAEIRPTGLWLPEMGFLPWGEIAEVRLERMRGPGSGDAPATQQHRRLGVVPRDPAHRPSGATTLGWRMANLYFAFVRAIAPEVRVGGDDAAPFGVGELEVPDDFEAIVELVRRHAPVIDAAEARARDRAARWTGPDVAPPTDAPTLARLDAALAPGAAGTHPEVVAGALVPRQPPLRPAATFRPPAVKPLQVLLALLPVAAPLLFVGPFVVPQILARGGTGTFALVFVAFIVLVFVLPGVVAIVRLVRRARARRTPTLRVGPDGIWTRDAGLVTWSSIRDIRTERGGWVGLPGGPQVERWLLVVEATDGTVGTAPSDELGATFDDVLDLVRFYHPVTERS